MAFDEKKYWNRRYSKGRDSGFGSTDPDVSGFKALKINEFIKQNNLTTMLDLGCGDGKFLTKIEVPQYHGVDVSNFIISKLQESFDKKGREFYELNSMPNAIYDVVLSMEVVDSCVEDSRYEEHLDLISIKSKRFAIICASNQSEPYQAGAYSRKRIFVPDIEKRGFTLIQQTKNPFYPYDIYFFDKNPPVIHYDNVSKQRRDGTRQSYNPVLGASIRRKGRR